MKTDEQLIYEQYDTIQQIMSRIKNGKIEGDVDLSNLDLQKLPDLSQVEVTGDFDCSYNQLTSLEGAPHTVGRSFYCLNNDLTSLDGIPPRIGINTLIGHTLRNGGGYCTFTEEEIQQAIKKAQQAEMKHHTRSDDSMVTDLLDF